MTRCTDMINLCIKNSLTQGQAEFIGLPTLFIDGGQVKQFVAVAPEHVNYLLKN